MPFVSGREILEQIAGTSSLVTLSVYLQKTVGLSMVRNLFCVNSVPLLWHFSLYCYPKIFMFPLPPNLGQFMWLLLALVAIPTINQ